MAAKPHVGNRHLAKVPYLIDLRVEVPPGGVDVLPPRPNPVMASVGATAFDRYEARVELQVGIAEREEGIEVAPLEGVIRSEGKLHVLLRHHPLVSRLAEGRRGSRTRCSHDSEQDPKIFGKRPPPRRSRHRNRPIFPGNGSIRGRHHQNFGIPQGFGGLEGRSRLDPGKSKERGGFAAAAQQVGTAWPTIHVGVSGYSRPSCSPWPWPWPRAPRPTSTRESGDSGALGLDRPRQPRRHPTSSRGPSAAQGENVDLAVNGSGHIYWSPSGTRSAAPARRHQRRPKLFPPRGAAASGVRPPPRSHGDSDHIYWRTYQKLEAG